MRESVEAKARRYVGEGRLRLVHVQGDVVTAEVRGEASYDVQLIAGDWHCSCPARTPRCCHVIAAELVTVPSRA